MINTEESSLKDFNNLNQDPILARPKAELNPGSTLLNGPNRRFLDGQRVYKPKSLAPLKIAENTLQSLMEVPTKSESARAANEALESAYLNSLKY